MKAVLLAGGMGRRLSPYTSVIPKPLFPIGGTTIIEVILQQLALYGFVEVVVCVGYMADLVEAYLGDGSKYGVMLTYSVEDKPLGTLGPLSLIETPKDPFLLMNGDVLTTIDFAHMMCDHQESGATITVATHLYKRRLDYGVMELDEEDKVRGFYEKPETEYQVNMGIYAMSPAVLQWLQRGQRCDVPEVIAECLRKGLSVRAHRFVGDWIDIGRMPELQEANRLFDSRKLEFLPTRSEST